MPIYEYRCGKCGDFEAMQKITDKPLRECPTCGRKVTKLMSSGGFHLKGSGWYVTDYPRKHDGSGKGEKKDEKKGEEKAETKDAGGKTATTSDTGGSEKKGGAEKAAAA